MSLTHCDKLKRLSMFLVDDDIDIYDPLSVEWAIATRVQGDKDVIVVPGARAKPLDPSLLQGAGVVPIGAKVGIDATIPEHIPKEHYERITYAYAETAKVVLDEMAAAAPPASHPSRLPSQLIRLLLQRLTPLRQTAAAGAAKAVSGSAAAGHPR